MQDEIRKDHKDKSKVDVREDKKYDLEKVKPQPNTQDTWVAMKIKGENLKKKDRQYRSSKDELNSSIEKDDNTDVRELKCDDKAVDDRLEKHKRDERQKERDRRDRERNEKLKEERKRSKIDDEERRRIRVEDEERRRVRLEDEERRRAKIEDDERRRLKNDDDERRRRRRMD